MQQASRWVQALRWWRLGLHLLRGAGIVALRFPWLALAEQRALRQGWCRQLLGVLGITLIQPQSQPQPATRAAQGELLVANHISWLDIFVFNAYAQMDFVAKEEVQNWYFFGWLARKNGTLFLSRHSPLQAQALNAELSARLQTGQRVLVFPEGTTSAGQGVLPFHPALFQAAIDSACVVQPLALQYLDRQGERSRAPAYAGETTVWQSLCAIIAADGLQAKLQACPRLEPDAGQRQRRRLAHSARTAILAATQGESLRHGQTLTPADAEQILALPLELGT